MVTWGCSRVLPTDLVSENAEGWQQPLAATHFPLFVVPQYVDEPLQ